VRAFVRIVFVLFLFCDFMEGGFSTALLICLAGGIDFVVYLLYFFEN
jgi:hypothetical protein